MPEASVVTSSTAASHRPDAPSFAGTRSPVGSSAAWVDLAGELDLATSPQLRQTLEDVRLDARLVVLDLRELTFIDSCGVSVILDAAGRARREGRQVMLVRGPAQVERVLTLTTAAAHVLVFDLDPAEPAPELHLAPTRAAA